MIATVLALLLALACPTPAPTARADGLLAASEQQGQAQRPLNTPMVAGQQQEEP